MASLVCHWLELTDEAARPEEREKKPEKEIKLDELLLLEQVRSSVFTSRLRINGIELQSMIRSRRHLL